MSAFDKEAFMNAIVEDANETKFTPVPEAEYEAYIDSVEADEINDKPVLQVDFALIDEDLKIEMNMDKVTIRKTYWLDFTEEGALDFGKNKNIQLGLLREACGQNVAGEPWAPSMLAGQGPLLILNGHRYNKETGEGPYNNVKRVTAAG